MVSRFGHIVRVVDTPGLHLKLPFERVLSVDRRLLYSKPAQAEYLTSDKKNVVVRSLALWRIADPKRFLETVRNRAGAELQLADVVHAEVGAALGNYPFASFVSAAGGESHFMTLVGEVHDAVQAHALPAFGIDVVELDVRQLYLPEANRQSVFERMKAERGKIAKQFRSEGERDAKRLIAEAEREKTRIDRRGLRGGGAHQGRGRSRGDGDLRRRARAQCGILQVPAHPAGLREAARRQDHAVPAGRCRDLGDFAGERRCHRCAGDRARIAGCRRRRCAGRRATRAATPRGVG